MRTDERPGIPPELEDHLATTLKNLGDLEREFSEGLNFAREGEYESITRLHNERDPKLDRFIHHGQHRARITVDTIHSGNIVPERYLVSIIRALPNNPEVLASIINGYRKEKDWGANYLAAALAKTLNLDCSYHVNIARILLDYGRFPGITQRGASHLNRFAINYPFSHMPHKDKRDLLEIHYDTISNTIEKAVFDPNTRLPKILKISIHTYDKFNPGEANHERGTLRPEISVIYTPDAYHKDNRLPYGLFDPIYPEELSESTADRRLVARIILNLETAGLTVAQNLPYSFPEGSVEVRAQVWLFFQHLRKVFEERTGITGDEYDAVWDMLLDTNHRSTLSAYLRNYLHMYRRATPAQHLGNSAELSKIMSDLVEQARRAYERIERFLAEGRDDILHDYRKSPDRPSSLALEVRKDVLWEFDDNEKRVQNAPPGRLRLENLQRITRHLTLAIYDYLRFDRKDLTG